MAGSYPISIIQGDTFNLNFTIDIDGTPWDLSTYTAKLQVRQSTFSTDTLLNLSTDSGITLNNLGEVSCTASSTLTSAMPVGRWIYDFELTSGGGEKTTILQDVFVVGSQVSQ